MARKNAPAQAPTNEADTTTESTEEAAPVDLSGFEAAVETALATRDSSTGEVAPADVAPVTEEYRKLDGQSGKRPARDLIEERMKASIKAKDVTAARAFISLRDGLTAGKSPSTAAPKDPTEGFVLKLASLAAARELLESRVPEGVSDSWVDQLHGKIEELSKEAATALDAAEDEEVEISPEARKVVRLAAGRVAGGGSTFTGPRRDIGKHLEQVFANLDNGDFLTIAEIAKTKTDEYGDDNPSSGAVSSRLFPKSGKPSLPEGIEPTPSDGDRSRGATKVA